MQKPRFTLIGNPENRRAAYFRAACEQFSYPAPIEISWQTLLRDGRFHKEELRRATSTIRIESPGENFAVEKLLIALGHDSNKSGFILKKSALALKEDHGRLQYQHQWYRGWCSTLLKLYAEKPESNFMNHPEDIALMFDKWHCQKKLSQAGLPIPLQLGRVSSYKNLRKKMQNFKVQRVFIKPRHGSSASGVVALETSSSNRIQAFSPVDIQQGKYLYNSLRLRRYQTESEVRNLVDLLSKEHVIAEQWFPKAMINGRTFDLRVLMIAGECKHIVARTSRSPITNLHLGNKRGDISEIRDRVGNIKWQEALSVCEQAAQVFPRCHYLAVDLMISSDHQRLAIAEINAFGDLLPEVLVNGLGSYSAEIKSF